jgi:hypothetical protein
MKPSALKSAIRKCRLFCKKTGQWCGCLTPSEILALRKAGVKFEDHSYGDRMTDKWMKQGISNPVWVYFYPNHVVMKED